MSREEWQPEPWKLDKAACFILAGSVVLWCVVLGFAWVMAR